MTIDELLTREEIKQLRIGYAAHLDSQDLDALVALFTEDAVCEFGAEFGGDWIGRAQIRDNYAAQITLIGSPFDAIHVVTNPWIELTGATTARGRWYLIDLLTRQRPATAMATPGGHANPLLFLAIYDDEYRKEAEGWRIARTRLHFLWPERQMEAPPA